MYSNIFADVDNFFGAEVQTIFWALVYRPRPKWTLIIKNTDITKSRYNKVIFSAPKYKFLCSLLFLQPGYNTVISLGPRSLL